MQTRLKLIFVNLLVNVLTAIFETKRAFSLLHGRIKGSMAKKTTTKNNSRNYFLENKKLLS